jgi:hypothetical protein
MKNGQVKEPNCIGGDGGSVMATMLVSSVVDRGFEICIFINTTTAIKIFDFGQREVITFFT